MRKAMLAWGAAALATVGTAAVGVPALASPGGGGCTLAGNATFNGTGPGDNPSATWTYGFTGTLSNCAASPGAPTETGGTVSAGKSITFVDENPADSTYGQTVTENEPAATGTGSCGSSSTAGISFVQWAGGGITILQYATDGAGPLVVLNGSPYAGTNDGVLAQYQFTNGPIIKSTVYNGDGGVGTLAFQPPSPAACTTATGVGSAGISGFVGLGGAS